MKRIMSLVRLEVKSILYDKGLLLLLIGGPLFYSFFYPFPYSADIVRNIPTAIVDMDNTQTSKTLARMLDASEEIELNGGYTTLGDAHKALLKRKVFGIVYIENGFEKDILSNIPQKVRIYTDASYLVYYKQISTGAQKAVKTMSAGIEIKKLQAKGAGKAAYSMRSPINVALKNLYNPGGGYTEYIVPIVFIVIIHQMLLIAIGMRAGTLREKKKYYRHEVSPWRIFWSKTMAFSLFGLGYFIYFFVIMYNIFGFSGGGNVAGLFIFYIPFLLSTIFLGLTLSCFFREREEAMLLIIVTSIPILFLSGAIWPDYLMPGSMKLLRLFLPSTHGAEGVLRLFIMETNFTACAKYFGYLWFLTALYAATAYYAIAKRYPLKI